MEGMIGIKDIKVEDHILVLTVRENTRDIEVIGQDQEIEEIGETEAIEINAEVDHQEIEKEEIGIDMTEKGMIETGTIEIGKDIKEVEIVEDLKMKKILPRKLLDSHLKKEEQCLPNGMKKTRNRRM